MTAISKVKETLATLKGAEATLEMYSLQERDKDAKIGRASCRERV